MKSQFKNYHTLSFKYLRKIFNLSSNELKNLHDKFVEKSTKKEKSKIENIDFNIKNKNIFNVKSSEFEYKLIDNSLDLFSLGKYMHNCVYTRLKSIVSNKSLIYQITYKNKDYCLEVNTSNKNKLSILELKARFNKEAPKNLFHSITKNLKQHL